MNIYLSLSPRARRVIFARGVRFIRFMSTSVRGRLSGSLNAAECFSASVIASRRRQSCFAAVFLAVLFMVSASLVWLCLARRDDPHSIASQRMSDDQWLCPLPPLTPAVAVNDLGERAAPEGPEFAHGITDGKD